MSNSGDDNQVSQLFIVGAGRSGTTYLGSLLEGSSYGKPVESHFITKYHEKLEEYGDLNEKDNFCRLVNSILHERSIMQWKLKLDVDSFFKEFKAEIKYSEIVNKLFLKSPRFCRGNAWGDKTPHYTKDIDILNKLFPSAKYIYIVRDGRDVAMSLKKMPWGPKNIYSCAEYWKTYNKPSPELELLIKKDQMLYLNYEDIMTDTSMSIRKIYQFIGEEISEEKIDRLSETAISNNFYKWKTALTPKQIQIFESVAGDTLIRHGYTVVSKTRLDMSWRRIVYKLHNQFCHYVFLFRINVIDGIKIRLFGGEPFNE